MTTKRCKGWCVSIHTVICMNLQKATVTLGKKRAVYLELNREDSCPGQTVYLQTLESTGLTF